ncbi:hypothetical protein BU197_17360 [Streptomyces sp. CBMA291]|nr:hypothetical protein [Streptomyces sp. CBMA291]MBD0715626.1 hypothetical protein [Streptomyces sp. CBMA370]
MPPRATVLLAAALLALTGCASTVDSLERLGRKAVERIGTGPAHGTGQRPPTAAGTGAAGTR